MGSRQWLKITTDNCPLATDPLSNSLSKLRHQLILVHPPLLEAVAVAERDRTVAECLAINRDAKRRAGFVLAAIAAANGAAFVVEHGHVGLDGAIDALGDFRHAVFFDERENSSLDGGDPGMKTHHDASLHLA